MNGTEFVEIFRSHDPIKMKILKDCLLLSSKIELICLQQTSFVNNQSPANPKFPNFNKKNFSHDKDVRVELQFCQNSMIFFKMIRKMIEFSLNQNDRGTLKEFFRQGKRKMWSFEFYDDFFSIFVKITT